MVVDFSKGAVLVIGDLMLDRYYAGSVSRMSPEAPVPVVNVSKSFETLGGAGNVAANCASLGAPVTLVGALGGDADGRLYRRLCALGRIRLHALPSGSRTITKTRVIGERQQIVRIDVEEKPQPSGAKALSSARKAVARYLKTAKAVVLSDYGKGFCSPELSSFVITKASKRNVPVIVDPKGHLWQKYRGAYIVTPNVKELSEIAGRPVKNDDGAVSLYAKKVRARYGLRALLVTRSEKGMTLVAGRRVEHFPTEAREVFDVSGAGDTVVAALAACLASRITLPEAVETANKAAGIVVGKAGTAPVPLAELRAVLDNSNNPKLLDARALIERCADERRKGKKVVFTNGCFDILHRGHVHLMEQAKKLGNLLVVALNSDRSIKIIKGPSFPINSETDRAHLIAAINSVDFITIFNGKTPARLIREIRPDVLVKGGNYRKNEVLGSKFAKDTIIIPNLAGYSTKLIRQKISRS
ncbi:MAG: bifunctional heptose 7-phosphate kinase/heptose 1-phosphate adenyltransferase [Chitinispirillaceae bacterium]|nr:bifunctional heptose 7-phosphate kinase/heptose 1-phosphate adenyltransferase [Chitinispirillaceae bacterium]